MRGSSLQARPDLSEDLFGRPRLQITCVESAVAPLCLREPQGFQLSFGQTLEARKEAIRHVSTILRVELKGFFH